MQRAADNAAARQALIGMLPRLKRFADLLAGEREEGRAVLRRALTQLLLEQPHSEPQADFERRAFAETYRLWLAEFRGQADPKVNDRAFARLFRSEESDDFDPLTVGFLASLPPQLRVALLLVHGEGFDHEDAARILDTTADALSARLVRGAAGLADRIALRADAAPYDVEPAMALGANG